MANYSYGSLSVPVTADTRPLAAGVRDGAISAGRAAADRIKKDVDTAFRDVTRAAKDIAKGLGTAIGAGAAALGAFGVESVKTAARVGSMDAALRALAKANKLNERSVMAQVEAVRKTGVEYGVAQNTIADFIKNQIDVSKATDVARVAQNLAVVSNRNSSEVLQDLIHGISTQNSTVLKSAGSTVQAGRAMREYAKQLGKSATDLTSAERAQAVLNAVLADGEKVAGAYASAMEEPGKVLTSFPRLIEWTKVAIGRALLPAFKDVILESYQLAKAFTDMLGEGGKLAPMLTAFGQGLTGLTKPLVDLLRRWRAWLDSLDPATIKRISETIKRLTPAIVAVGGALALMTTGKIISGFGLAGGLLGAVSALIEPVSRLGTGLARVLLPAIIKLVPNLGPLAKGLGDAAEAPKGFKAAITGTLGPLGAFAAVFGLLMTLSPEFREAVLAVAKDLMSELRPAVTEIGAVLKALSPSLTLIIRSLGKALVPVVEEAGGVFVTLAGVLTRVLIVALKILVPILDAIGPALGPVLAGFLGLVTVIKSAHAVNTVYLVVQTSVAKGMLIYNLALKANVKALLTGTISTKAHTVATIAQTVAMKLGAVAAKLLGLAMTAAGGPVGLIIVAIFALVAAFVILWKRSAAFRNFWIAIWSAMQKATKAVWDWIKRYWPQLLVVIAGPIGAAAVLIIKNWDKIKSAASSAWSHIRTIYGHLTSGIAGVGKAFEGAQRVIASAWVKVKDAVAGPSRWVAFSIINPLLKGANLLLGKIGMKIPEIPKFARGGPVPGWGRGDRTPALLEPGEWVLTRRQAAAIGYDRLARIPRFLTGGPVPRWNPVNWIGGAASKVGSGAFDKVKKLGGSVVDKFSGLLEWAAVEAFTAATKPIKKLLEPAAKAAVPPYLFRSAFGKLGIKALDGLVGLIEGKSGGEFSASGIVALAKRYNGHRYVWGGGANERTGFDCSSFISMLGGMMGLPLPGGFRAPAASHGPITNDYMAHSGMRTVPFGQMAPGDVAVNTQHIILVTGKGQGFAARSTATGTGPQAVDSSYMIRRWPGMLAQGGKGGVGGAHPFGNIGSASLQKVAAWVLGKFGVGYLLNAYMARLRQESGFNQRAVNKWDINWQMGYPSVGYAQVIRPTFQAHAGPYRNRGPFMYGVSIDPLANLWASVAYSISRYGKAGLASAWSGTKGYARGGTLYEPVFGVGLRSGQTYAFGENAPAVPEDFAPRGQGGRASTIINVYPRANQSETEIAAAVDRRLGWTNRHGRG